MAGDRRAFELLVKEHQASVRALGRRLAGSASAGDDIAQAAFLTAWRRRETWDGGAFKGWVCTIAYREFLQARRVRTPPMQALEDVDVAAEAASPAERMDLHKAMAQLEENERAAIALCLGAGLSHSEAALAMQAPLGSVKSWVLRGRDKLQLLLAAYENV